MDRTRKVFKTKSALRNFYGEKTTPNGFRIVKRYVLISKKR